MEECTSGKTLLIVSGGVEAIPGIQRAKEMGLYVVVSDGNPNAPGFEYADDCIIASTYDVNETVQKAKLYHRTVKKLDGVICIASDTPLTVASVAKEIGLPGIPIEAAELAIDKMAMKNKFKTAGIPIPEFIEIHRYNELINTVENWGYPIVIKPVDSRGARGVLKLTEKVDLQWAWNHSKENSPTGRVMLEKYLNGPQVSTEAIIVNGVGHPVGFSDRNYEFEDKFSPYIIENGGESPSKIADHHQTSISEMAIKAGISLGITNGIAKGDMVLTENGPKVIEVATRLSGGWFSTDQIPLGLGIDLIGSAIKLALDEKINEKELLPKYHKGVAIRYFFPKPGIVKEINISKKYENVNWIHRVKVFVEPGDKIEEVTNHTKRSGFVITTGKTSEIAVERAINFANSVRIDTVSTT
jgi:biotin carboxylase